jgi:predicted Zn finger-like uncharacterized protein
VEPRARPIGRLTGHGSGTPKAALPARYGFQFVNGSDGSTGIGVVILIRAMLIVCPSCTTSYTVRPNSLRPYGQTRCLRCLAIWSPQRHRAEMLVAAAAAIAAEFTPLPEPGGAGANPQGDSGHVETPNFQPDPLIFDEFGVANLNPDGASETADAKSGPDEASANHEIYFVDLDPDNPPFVPEDTAVDHGTEGAVVDQGQEAFIAPELTPLDSPATDAAGVSDQFASLNANVAPVPLAPTEEQLPGSPSEAPASAEAVGAPVGNKWVSDYLVAQGTKDDTSANRAVAAVEQTPVANEEEVDSSAQRWGAEDGSAAAEASEHGAALIREPRPDARRWIVLKANNSGTPSSKAVTDIALRNALRPRHNLPVPSRGLPPPARRRFVPRWPLTRLQVGIVALALLDFLLVGWRTDIVRKLPQTASFYELAGLPVNLRGLAFHGITTTTVRDGGKPVLVVEGDIVNNTAKALRVPQLRFAVRDAADQEIYFWTATATRTSLPPGQAVAFRARLASPPAGARDVVLRFVNRRDVVAMNP